MLTKLEDLEILLGKKKCKPNICLVCSHDIHSLEAIKMAVDKGLICATLIGDKEKTIEYMNKIGFSQDFVTLHECESDKASAEFGVLLAKQGEVDTLMKGKLQTKVFLKAVVNSESGIKDSELLSMIVLNEIPGYKKLVCLTDSGMVMYPNFDEKVAIVKNAVKFFNSIGYERPKVAALCAVEVVNPKMPETVDAKKLKDMNIENCYIEGPISYDLTFSEKSAKIKGYESPVTGDVDILLVPDITSGNILGKTYVYTCGGRMAGVVVGAKVPVVLTSRGGSAEDKYFSILLAALGI